MGFFSLRLPDSERPLHCVPRLAIALLVIMFLLQIGLQGRLPVQQAAARDLPEVPNMDILQLTTFGDRIVLSKVLMLWLQAFDNQPGISLPFRQLDYLKLRDWLAAIMSLDPQSHYPLLSASRVYGEVSDASRKRIMIDFVRQQFNQAPTERWEWMAHAVFMAKHQLKDLQLALQLAREISHSVPVNSAPAWARQMELYILEDMDELESAKVLVGGLLESGQITDEHELRYLQQKLTELEQRISEGQD